MISRAHSNESRIFPPVGDRNPFIQAELVDVPKVWGLESIAVVGFLAHQKSLAILRQNCILVAWEGITLRTIW